MSTTWNLRPANESAVDQLARGLGLPRALARVLWLRGYHTVDTAREFLASRDSLSYLETPIDTPGMNKAVARMRAAVAADEPFVIYGDYDCDGVTSTAVLYRYFKRGLKANCEAYLPDRFKDGYGVTAAAVERIAARGIKLILTCDNGISAMAAAEKARELGVDLVVTDHHLVPEVLPDVHAIVHPQLEFPHLKDLAGVGVAFLFTIAMEGGYTPRMAHFLDFVTLGTVGDVVPLDGPNRPLVWAGIERYRAGKSPWPGIAALGAVAKSNYEALTATDIGFQLVPRLNAAGRLETPDVGFKLLATNDKDEAAMLAEHLDGVNRQRRDMSAELEAQVCGRLEAEWDFEKEPFVVLADPAFHHGITGIIAGRIKEKYRVPVLLFSGHGDGPWKASGRAPDGVHLYEALHACRDLLVGFGGHAGAAGGAALEHNLLPLRERLNRHVHDLGWSRPDDAVWLDAELPFEEADDRLLAELDALEPFGQRNPQPIFGLMQARVVSQRVRERHLFLQVDDGRAVREVIAWGKASEAPSLAGWVRLTYTARYNTFRGESKIQFVASRIEATEAPLGLVLDPGASARGLVIEDRRGEAPAAVLQGLAEPLTIYALPGTLGKDTLPPDGSEVLDPLHRIGPQAGHVVLFDLPHDEATWRLLSARASRLTIAWRREEAEEPALTPAWLKEFYLSLATPPGHAMETLLSAASSEKRHAAIAAARILRDAGLMVERHGQRQLLAAPGGEIPLGGLPAWHAHRVAVAFRARLAAATAAQLEAQLVRGDGVPAAIR